MKLAIFSPYYPPHTGGLETHSDEFNRYLSEGGTDIVVFTPHLPESAPAREMLHHGRVRVIRYPAFEIIRNYPLPKVWEHDFRVAWRELTQETYDLVISRTRFFFSSLLALIFAKRKKTRWVHIEHGSEYVRLSSSWKTLSARLYDETLGRLVLRSSDRNVAISEAVREFVARFDRRPVPVIYRGLDFAALDTVRPDDGIRRRFPDQVICVTAARLYAWKNIAASVKAIKYLPETLRKRTVFLVLGDGEDRERLETLAAGLPVHFLGDLPREQVLAILKASDIYLHTSLPGGGLSTSLLEAMYAGCAIIATPHEGAREVVADGETGLLLTGATVGDLASAVERLAADVPERKRLGTAARERIAERFDWPHSIEAYLRLFHTL